MNREQIEALSGRELDAELAYAFGWAMVDEYQGAGIPPIELARVEADKSLEADDVRFAALPHYSTTWAGLELAVTEMQHRGGFKFSMECRRTLSNLWLACFGDAPSSAGCWGETAPLAVARAALLALAGAE